MIHVLQLMGQHWYTMLSPIVYTQDSPCYTFCGFIQIREICVYHYSVMNGFISILPTGVPCALPIHLSFPLPKFLQPLVFPIISIVIPFPKCHSWMMKYIVFTGLLFSFSNLYLHCVFVPDSIFLFIAASSSILWITSLFIYPSVGHSGCWCLYLVEFLNYYDG